MPGRDPADPAPADFSAGRLDAGQVRTMFDRVAGVYDLLNTVMTAGLHHRWRERAVQCARVRPGDRVLDVATGTGDLALALAKRVSPGGEVVGSDFSEGMLARARAKAERKRARATASARAPRGPASASVSERERTDEEAERERKRARGGESASVSERGQMSEGGAAESALGGGRAREGEGDKGKGGAEMPALDVAGGAALSFEWGDALELPYPDDSFDAATVGFGARNFADLSRGLAEMARVVRPGGRVVVLEMTTPTRPPLSWFYGLWFDRAVPLIGRLAALVARAAPGSAGHAGSGGGGDEGGGGGSAQSIIAQAYTYLPNSVKRFHSPAELAAELERAGCVDVRYVLMAGGIIALHGATVPR
jgi:demethylmenaquinone methyltransferase/2-methoxy-6-polyprenyl-1,4-benzoquinol methylase